MTSVEGPINVTEWLKEHEKDFVPPVCNKLMFGKGQWKVMFIGGPNQRRDYHIEEGEEFFYQIRGDMVLKVVEQGKHKDIVIKEGQGFLLPARIPHSPQRFENTVGLVLEREREESEFDCLRWYFDPSLPGNEGKDLDILYEEWFHCYDLGVQLGPVIKRFFSLPEGSKGIQTEQTRKMLKENPTKFELDNETQTHTPFSIADWIKDHRSELQKGPIAPFPGEKNEFKIRALSQDTHKGSTGAGEEAFFWQFEGAGKVSISVGDVKPVVYNLDKDQVLLLPQNSSYQFFGDSSSVCFEFLVPRKQGA